MAKLQFHPRCGSNAEVTNGQRTALRQTPEDDYTNGAVLTSRPLRVGEIFEVTIDEVVDSWIGSLQIGVTTHSPDTLQFPSAMTDVTSGTTWILTAFGVKRNGETINDDYGQSLDDLTRGDRVGVVMKEDNSLHFTINGEDQGEAATDIPAEVYGVVDLIAQAAKVTIVDHSDSSLNTRSIYLKQYAEQPIHLPKNWKVVKKLEGDTVTTVEVDKDLADAIKKLVEVSWDYDLVGYGADAKHLKHKAIEVTKVVQIESTSLYKEYEQQRKDFCKRAAAKSFPKVTCDPDEKEIQTSVHGIPLLDDQLIPEINEHFLFHGAKVEFVDAILKQGIDYRLASAGLFGSGAYFCERTTKGDQYTDSKDGRAGGEHVMFLTKVILGHIYNAKKGNKTMKRPPCVHHCTGKCEHKKSEFYDSVMGTHVIDRHTNNLRKLLFREFIIFEKRQCYPTYIITYVRK
ncbi:hypothetical protein NP493_518g01025 [Ridgeia piscesae]|uniref:Poly [ADP-ribose] polymerase n=1 Tax=Ridgeia piscesae TaxID=27915 RepID=A0AAD9KY42_RIDPI|nr:hypothetical protein NP493_518g01025 [Ridgeia piscesae]